MTRGIVVANSRDVQTAIEASHKLLRELPLNRPKRFLTATAVSELARNLVVHAGGGLLSLRVIENEGRLGFEVVAEDKGPGIADVFLALTEGYSTAKSLGLGLPGVQRIMDELYFDEDRAVGTRIVARRWA
jgi:serine/threonine-protein kinase RsbT